MNAAGEGRTSTLNTEGFAALVETGAKGFTGTYFGRNPAPTRPPAALLDTLGIFGLILVLVAVLMVTGWALAAPAP